MFPHSQRRTHAPPQAPQTTAPPPRLSPRRRPQRRPPKPRWDAVARELWYDGQLVKRFTQPSRNQERILAALEEEGWPPRIDDPLPGDRRVDRHNRLREAIRSLNEHQAHKLLVFARDGRGQGLTWRPMEP
jgi:hypothetical protein